MRWLARSGSAAPGRVGASHLWSIELCSIGVPALPIRRNRTLSILYADFREDRLHRFSVMRLRGWSMGYSLEQFSAACHRILSDDSGAEGRKKVCALVENVLKDQAFVAAQLGDDVPERKILYEDPELGFCILGHVNHGARESKPHDHGPSWAIYGQARGETGMSQWALGAAAAEPNPGKGRLFRKYTLVPGMAQIYNEGDLHSPSRSGSARLIRIEGQNLEKIHRLAYEAA